MDSPAVLAGAIILCFGALLLVFLVVAAPVHGPIPLSRRRPEGGPEQSSLGKVSHTLVSSVDKALGKSGGPFNRDLLYNASVKLGPADFTVLVAVASLSLCLLGWLLVNPLIGILLGAAVPFLTRLLLTIRTDKRQGKFEAQLIDTIQMLIGGLRAGHSVVRSVEAAGLESEAPTSEELRRIVNDVRIGKDLGQALEETAGRMDSEDFRWVGQAIQINREVGGDLAEVLEQVAGTIRERGEIKGHVRALSAEGKMSAYILMALPIVVAVFVGMINPGYLNVFVDEPIGVFLMGLSFVMFVIGGFWMSRITKIKF